jgi:hypothetical protein
MRIPWPPHAVGRIISSSLALALARHTAMSRTLNRCEVLARIDRDIAEGKRHVAEQIGLIKWMREECLDTTLAQNLLCNLEQILGRWHAHRQLILEANPQDQEYDL